MRGRVERMNVLIVVADDMAQRELPALYGHLWDYEGEDPPYTPNIEALAGVGTVLERVQSSANCSPTRASLQFARYPHRFGIGDVLKAQEGDMFPAPEPDSVPQVFKDAGYATACFGKWHLSHPISKTAPLAHGWDRYLAGHHGGAYLQTGPFNWNRNDDGQLTVEERYAPLVQCEVAANWIRQQTGPWYAQVNFNTPHLPLHIPPLELLPGTFNASSDREMFKLAITALDKCLDHLIRAVDMSSTIVVFMSDNGTPSGLQHMNADPDKQKKTLYREGIEVPCVVAGPTTGAWMDGMDIPELMFQVAREALGAGGLPDTWDFQTDYSGYAYSERFTPNGDGPYVERTQVVRKGDWKLMRDWIDGAWSYRLFDLANDPNETTHVDNPAKQAELTLIMESVQ